MKTRFAEAIDTLTDLYLATDTDDDETYAHAKHAVAEYETRITQLFSVDEAEAIRIRAQAGATARAIYGIC